MDTQERASLEFVQAAGWQVVECIRDTASGFTLDRPGIERLRQLLHHGADVVVAYAVDRLSRNQNHIGVLFDEVQQANARLEFVTEKFEDTAVGRFILNVRAFVAEVEREKIKERTSRGKAERARSGKIPQATGKGIYGYTYDRGTGRRVINLEQAEVVRRVFADFVSGKPIVAIANCINQAGIPAYEGGLWYSPTVFKILKNPAYAGRTIYRRTLVRNVRDPKTGKKRRKVDVRNPEAWIEIPNATPAVVDGPTFDKVQTILEDPERRRLGRRIHDYALSGRVKCRVCGKAIVGQTINKTFRYYRCRRAFSGPRHDRCTATYIQADALESAVRHEITDVLSNPARILAQHQAQVSAPVPHVDLEGIQRQLQALDDQKARLLKLYQLGEIDDAYLQAESCAIRTKRAGLEAELDDRQEQDPMPELADLQEACDRIRAWVKTAGADELSLMLEGLQVTILAERDHGNLKGIIPEYSQGCSHADVRSVVN